MACEIGTEKTWERTASDARSMIPEPHRVISSTYITPRNASTARPGEHRVVRAATPPRAAVFEWETTRKRREKAQKRASRRTRSRASLTKRAVFACALTLGWSRVTSPNFHAKRAETTTGRSVYDSRGSPSTKLLPPTKLVTLDPYQTESLKPKYHFSGRFPSSVRLQIFLCTPMFLSVSTARGPSRRETQLVSTNAPTNITTL